MTHGETDGNLGCVGLTKEETDYILFLIYASFIAPLSVCGLLLNLLNIIIYRNTQSNPVTRLLFITLTLADIGCLIILLFNFVLYIPSIHSIFGDHYGQWLLAGFPYKICSTFSNFNHAYISVERCLENYYPKIRSYITVKKMKVVLFISLLLIIILFIPEYTTRSMQFELLPNSTEKKLFVHYAHTSLDEYDLQHVVFTTKVFLNLTSLLINILASIVLYIKYRKLDRIDKYCANSLIRIHETRKSELFRSHTQAWNKKKRIEFILVFTVLFVFLRIPGQIVYIWYLFPGNCQDELRASFTFARCLRAVKACANTVIYYKFNSEYRKAFQTVISLKGLQRRLSHKPYSWISEELSTSKSHCQSFDDDICVRALLMNHPLKEFERTLSQPYPEETELLKNTMSKPADSSSKQDNAVNSKKRATKKVSFFHFHQEI